MPMKGPKDLYIEEDDDIILIKDSNDDRVFYRIRKAELLRTREDSYSDWIMQLLSKTWASTGLLYQLAKLIQHQYPDNKINWKKTFFVVEKSKYLDSLGDVLTEKTGSVAKDTFAEIDFGRKENNDETNKLIDEIVDVRLKEFGLK
jgi:hypothetical protein